jgi:hypothetical protein
MQTDMQTGIRKLIGAFLQVSIGNALECAVT